MLGLLTKQSIVSAIETILKASKALGMVTAKAFEELPTVRKVLARVHNEMEHGTNIQNH